MSFLLFRWCWVTKISKKSPEWFPTSSDSYHFFGESSEDETLWDLRLLRVICENNRSLLSHSLVYAGIRRWERVWEAEKLVYSHSVGSCLVLSLSFCLSVSGVCVLLSGPFISVMPTTAHCSMFSRMQSGYFSIQLFCNEYQSISEMAKYYEDRKL